MKAISATMAIATALAMLTPVSEARAQPAPQDAGGPAPVSAVVEQPRPFGYVIGDLVVQRVLLRAGRRPFEPAALPRAQRLGAWFERRSARIEAAPGGERWLIVEYQIINAPQALTAVNLPAWELEAAPGAGALSIPAWPIGVAPLTPPTVFSGGFGELRPDRPAPVIETAPLRRQVWVWSSACVATLAAWLGWVLWRNWRASANQPFARALRELQRMDDAAPEAWQSLHRAFDATAGRVVQPETLPLLFRRAPQLTPLKARIELFFTLSAQRFFGAGPHAATAPLSIRKLCSDLRRIEKRAER
jgi:mxaA protein